MNACAWTHYHLGGGGVGNYCVYISGFHVMAHHKPAYQVTRVMGNGDGHYYIVSICSHCSLDC